MKLLYGRTYEGRYKAIAEEVRNLEVLDLYCGDCKLADFVKNYKGADFNKIFIKSAKKRGLDVSLMDITKEKIPENECIVMQGSLYQFIPNHEEIIKRILKSAQKKAIISEPYINLANSKNRVVSLIAKILTKTSEPCDKRFTKQELINLFKKYNVTKIKDLGRDIMGVFEIKFKRDREKGIYKEI